MDRAVLGLLAAGHFSADICQAAVPAMLPFYVTDRHLSYAAAAGLVFAQTISSSVVQPLFGHLSDRRPMPWIMPAGVGLAAAAIAVSALAPTYGLIWLAIFVSGLGIAAYHPEGARYALYASGDRHASGMSVFSVGGNIGFAAGPIILTPILLLAGLDATWLGCLVPGAVAVALLVALPRVTSHRPAHTEVAARGLASAKDDDWPAFTRLSGVLLARTVVFYGLNTFIPLFWIGVLHQSKGAGGIALAVLLATGPVGTLLGGRLADRFSRRAVVTGGLALSAPFLVGVILVGQPLLATLLLVPLALAAYAPSSVVVVLGQEYLPSRIGTAAGITMGLSLSLGGVLTPAIGWVADRNGLVTALLLLAAVPVGGALVALTLPEPRLRSRRSA
jgi:FSR family fosmidomycin resistance protein-like MFS transporter